MNITRKITLILLVIIATQLSGCKLEIVPRLSNAIVHLFTCHKTQNETMFGWKWYWNNVCQKDEQPVSSNKNSKKTKN